ncbi:uncharacterized protein B0H18DRAFT_958911 [Fomitopsis serialis]|uniref:uncharacterized protein n=1 Tax=Fomitopsis serialis TaxID=139415 RepID=UPI002007FDB8|nr:uncharacterized protein B0H18DRAFT_958911 [Neoantrodia serialis]KAH9916209.1 hypothetical protein B0H18DRAFT_958911 [Neoantrodia serialis]
MPIGDHPFPSPIGGIPFPHDFAPALLFTILYAIVVPVGIYRLISKRSRTLAIAGTVVFMIERVADFAIRAAEAEKPSIRTGVFFVSWLQSAYAMGFLSITGDLGNIARLFVMKTTEGTPFTVQIPPAECAPRMEEEQPLTTPMDPFRDASSSYSQVPTAEEDVFEDEPRIRVWLKRIGLACILVRILAIGTAVVSGGAFYMGVVSVVQANIVQQTRYASSIIVLFLQMLALGEVVWALLTRPKRTPRRPALYLCAMISVIMVTTVYRLAAMMSFTTSLTSMGPGSLNGPTAKALFYTFHVAPEWVSSTMLLVVNVRDMYGVNGKGH